MTDSDHSKARELRFGAPFPRGSNLHTGMEKFAEVVAHESGGRLTVKLFPDSELGDLTGLLQRLREGSVDIALLGISTAADLPGGGALNVGALPYLFKNREWAARICNSPLFHSMYDTLARESNVRVFASYGERLPRAFHTTRGPVNRPADLRGMRIRIAPIDVYSYSTRVLGAEPVPTDLDQMYAALADGRIDGQENGLEVTLAYKLYEVAKFFAVTDIAPSLATWYTHEGLWQSFSAADRELLQRAAKAAGEVITRLGKEVNRNGLDVMRRAGVTITTPDIPAFREALKDVYLRYEGKVWPDSLVAQIRALQSSELPPD